MDLGARKPRGPRSRLVDHLLIWGVVALTFGLFAVSRDHLRGKAEVGDAVGFSIVFLATAYFLAWLPRIWQKTDRTRLEGLVIPLFMTLVLAYLHFIFVAAFIQPNATAIAAIAQLLSLIVLSMRDQ